jgi:hypothetical protein
MKTGKKKYIFIGGIVLFITLLTGFGLFAAWGPCGDFDRGFHPRFHDRGFHPGFHKKDFSEFLLWRLDKGVEELNLSEEQREKYNEIRSRIEKHLTEGMEDRGRLMQEFHSEIDREDPDVRLLAESLKKKINEISGFMEENLDLFVEFYESLDDAQKDRVIDGIRDRMEHHRT